MARFVAASMVIALVLGFAASAHADDDTDDRGFDRPYLAPKLMFGLGGEVEAEPDTSPSVSME